MLTHSTSTAAVGWQTRVKQPDHGKAFVESDKGGETSTENAAWNDVFVDLRSIDDFAEGVEQVARRVSLGRRAVEVYAAGETAVSEFFLNSTGAVTSPIVAGKDLLGRAKAFLLKTGLAAVGPLGLSALAGFLGVQGVREARNGIQTKNANKALEGTSTALLGAESGALAAHAASGVWSSPMVGAIGQVGRAAALPLAVAHIGVDLAQGGLQTARGLKAKDGHTLTDGLTSLGLGGAWAVGFATGPIVAAPLAAAMLAIKCVNNRKARKKTAQAHKERLAKPEAHPTHLMSEHSVTAVSFAPKTTCS